MLTWPIYHYSVYWANIELSFMCIVFGLKWSFHILNDLHLLQFWQHLFTLSMMSLLTLSKCTYLLLISWATIIMKSQICMKLKGRQISIFFPHQMILGELCILFALTFTYKLLHQWVVIVWFFLYWNRKYWKLMQWKNHIPWLLFCLSDFFSKLKSSNVNSKFHPENRLYHYQIQFNMPKWEVL